jgi:hypothetical protein
MIVLCPSIKDRRDSEVTAVATLSCEMSMLSYPFYSCYDSFCYSTAFDSFPFFSCRENKRVTIIFLGKKSVYVQMSGLLSLNNIGRLTIYPMHPPQSPSLILYLNRSSFTVRKVEADTKVGGNGGRRSPTPFDS